MVIIAYNHLKSNRKAQNSLLAIAFRIVLRYNQRRCIRTVKLWVIEGHAMACRQKLRFCQSIIKQQKKFRQKLFFDTIFPCYGVCCKQHAYDTSCRSPSYTPAERIHLSHYVTAPQGASRADFWHKTNGYRNGAKTYVCTEYASHLVGVCSQRRHFESADKNIPLPKMTAQNYKIGSALAPCPIKGKGLGLGC